VFLSEFSDKVYERGIVLYTRAKVPKPSILEEEIQE
jgi:hypothetical protein